MSHCAGAILDADIIITNPNCFFEMHEVTYTILSNSALKNNGTPHHIVRRSIEPRLYFGNSLNYFAFLAIRELQGNLSRCPSPILMKLKYIVGHQK